MRRSVVASLFLFALSTSAAACTVLAEEDAETQEAAHTEGDPTFAEHPWLWADETEEEFKRHAVENPSSWMGPADFLPLDHPMTERLQFWVDRMDEALRAEFADQVEGTPRPKLIIRKSDTANAWVSGIPVTWNVKARFRATDGEPSDGGAVDEGGDGGADGGSPQGASPLMLRRSGTVETTKATLFERGVTQDRLVQFARFFDENFIRCRVEVDGDRLLFGDDCASKNLRQRESETIAYYATAKYVTFTTGYILQLVDEDRIVSTLAHELGHYYRSHSNVPTDIVNYFYSLDTLHAHKPPPDPRYLEQTAEVRRKLRDGSRDWSEENALMRDQRLGFYTTEQEADEIALELMSKVGIPPGVAVDKVFNMLKNKSSTAAGDIGWTDCSMLRDHGWKDEAGKDVSIPVGDPSNAHHNLCFRAFNMTREINAHRYQPARRPSPPGEDWSRLFARLVADLDAPPAPPPADAGTD